MSTIIFLPVSPLSNAALVEERLDLAMLSPGTSPPDGLEAWFSSPTRRLVFARGDHPAISDCVVVMQEQETGDKRLVAYVVSNANRELNTSELSRFVGEKLPGYMIPAFFVMLDALPLTSSGKIDRKALPVPDHRRPELAEKYLLPKTEVERTVSSIWKEDATRK